MFIDLTKYFLPNYLLNISYLYNCLLKISKHIYSLYSIYYLGEHLSAIDDVLKYVATNEIRWIDLQFFDMKGVLHRMSLSNRSLEEASFGNGIHIGDLSEVYGPTKDELILLPDPDTLARLPWEAATIRLLCDVIVGVKKERFEKDPRYVAEKAETALSAAGMKTALVGSEVDCYMLDAASADRLNRARGSGFILDSREAKWNPSALANETGAYVPTPYDVFYAARSQISETMEDNFGMSIDSHRHGKSPSGQQTFELSERSLKGSADAVATLKFVTKNLASAINSQATFMPYPIEGEKGNSLNIALSLWKSAENNVFYDAKEDYAQLSQTGRYFIGGLLEHASALCVFCAPTPNSYKKLLMDNKKFGWSSTRNNSLVYVPYTKKNIKESKRVVYMGADPSANPYLAYSLVLAAGLDGIKSKIEPGDPTEVEGKKSRVEKMLPMSLNEALMSLSSDNKFVKSLLSSDLLDSYVELKTKQHRDSMKSITSMELQKYFSV